MFGQMTKWVAQIDRIERIPEYLSHAFHVAVSGRPGPVVLALPEGCPRGASGVVATRPMLASRRILVRQICRI
jgi:acetolactate synthase-1/2/3 large subunit